MTDLKVEPITSTVGAEISGVDLREPQSDEAIAKGAQSGNLAPIQGGGAPTPAKGQSRIVQGAPPSPGDRALGALG